MARKAAAKGDKYGVDWQDKGAAAECAVCHGGFGLKRRKHHCRNCGRVVCGGCSKTKHEVEGSAHAKRTCDECVETLRHPEQAALTQMATRWMARLAPDGRPQGAAEELLAAGASAGLAREVVLRRALKDLHASLLSPSGVSARSARGIVDLVDAAKAFLGSRGGTEADLEALCDILSHAFASANAISEASTLEASDAVALGALSTDGVDTVADAIFLDMLEMMQAQLFEPKWYGSDVTIRCVEATFYDFFEDLKHWLPGGSAHFPMLLDTCLKRFVLLYLQLLFQKGVCLDAAGSVAARIRGDMSIVRQLFHRYDALPEERIEEAVQPYSALQPLLDSAAHLPDALPVLAGTFGRLTLQVAKSVLYMHASMTDAAREQLLERCLAVPLSSGSAREDGVLSEVVAAPRRTEDGFYPWSTTEEERGNDERARPLTLRRARTLSEDSRPPSMCECFWSWVRRL